MDHVDHQVLITLDAVTKALLMACLERRQQSNSCQVSCPAQG